MESFLWCVVVLWYLTFFKVAGILRESVTYKIPDGLQTTQIEDLWLNRAYDFVVKYYGNKYVI